MSTNDIMVPLDCLIIIILKTNLVVSVKKSRGKSKFFVSSAARFRYLSPFGLPFEPFGDQYFALATLQFGYFLGYFWKIVKKPCLNGSGEKHRRYVGFRYFIRVSLMVFVIIFRALM